MTRSALVSLATLVAPAALALALAQPMAAQDTAAPADAAGAEAPAAEAPAAEGAEAPDGTSPDGGPGFSTGEPVVEGPRVAEVHDDWEVRCVKDETGGESCQMYQLLKEEPGGNSVAEITIVNLPPGGDAVAGATVVTPLGTLLTAALTFSVDGGTPRRYPFNWCDQFGCYARIGFLPAEVDQLRRGNAATMVIVPVVAPNQKVNIALSLKGFTAAFEGMEKLNAPAAGGN